MVSRTKIIVVWFHILGNKIFENLVCNISIQESLNLPNSQVQIVPNYPLSIVVSNEDYRYHNYSVIVDVTECLGFPQVHQLFAHPSKISLKPSLDINEGALIHTHVRISARSALQQHETPESYQDELGQVVHDTFSTDSVPMVPREGLQVTLSTETALTLLFIYFIQEFCWLVNKLLRVAFMTALMVSCSVIKILVS